MIKEVTSKADWQSILSKVNTYDFYHTYDYHEISCNLNKETPILVTYMHNDTLIALPLLLRKISNSDFYDFTSIYGYGGPVGKNIDASFDSEHFQNELKAYFKEKNVVSVFSRLHPYIEEQNNILGNIGNLVPLGRVVNIDVSLDLKDSRRAYQKSLKNQVNKLRRTCNVRKAETEQDILEFIDIYYENMKRLNAKESYFFKQDYFLNFLKMSDFNTEIFLVEKIDSKKLIAGSMFVKTNKFVQFHLSGSRTDYLKLKPSKLFIDEMRIVATNQHFDYFNLGGGLGSKEDSLFEFKSSFSKDFKMFKVWEFIVNEDAYNELSNANNSQNKDYFPLYRAN